MSQHFFFLSEIVGMCSQVLPSVLKGQSHQVLVLLENPMNVLV